VTEHADNGPAQSSGARGTEHDYDWIVIGSGFGGSVSALRLAEKGYRVAVLEAGRRFRDEDFATTTWNARRYYWLPRLGLKGILRMTLFKDIFVVSGCGVGGGSLGYANTLYRPTPGSAFYRDPQWSGLGDWESALAPHYETAERMLGVTRYEGEGPADRVLRDIAAELGVEHTYSTTRVGVFFGEPGETVPDPYFGGEGPPRAGCIRCGACMVGCRHNAKNTLMKNYLWFAERAGVEIVPERTVSVIEPLGAPDGSGGYAVTAERSGAWVGKDRRTLTAKGVVIAAGALGTNQLLQRCRHRGALPRLSERIGYLVRTNSEAISAVTTTNDRHDFTKSIAITSSFYPDPDTHIENVTYGRGADSMALLFTILGAARRKLARPLFPLRWSRRTVIILTMQTLDNSMRLIPKRNLFGLGPRLQTQEDPDKPNPRFIPVADQVTRRAAEKLDATPQAGLTEQLLNIPTTAHIMGGAVIGDSPETGVVDRRNRAFGYENLLVCDGAAVPANVGVNPSLTITALAEHAMSHVEARHAPLAGAIPSEGWRSRSASSS
jgi:cholesterol oxidase